ncbi:MAG: bifunctional phosphopantothenoylcysteine decarboxylase/phosphopantothenate--cysteine ligase CoaBC [Microbacteriaceae bacterium]|nr:bifunctional phosphopantothenoylcysteine decarboxylase/phosphopantothenate--cysteine ligase CoaBC [Microbacteriaceae bacterium]
MRILVGITGGIAAFKAVTLVRLLSELGHDVKVVPTQNALRFVGATTLEALSKNTVDSDLYTDVADVKHIELGQSADLVIVAPASASFIARTAAGIADDLLSNVILATAAPIIIAPAMHTEMWENAATKANVATILERGINMVEPTEGRLTGEDSGKGRMAEPEDILEAALALLIPQDLSGKAVVVTAGGTREPIDPVRFIGNSSSGKQGLEIAKEASRRGAQVTLIGANFEARGAFDFIRVVTTDELSAALAARATADVIVMAAAISDYRVQNPSATKIKKASTGAHLELTLIQNEDVLAKLAATKPAGQIVVGFAAETEPDAASLESAARNKLEQKGCDIIVANDVTDGKVFNENSSTVQIIQPGSPVVHLTGTKREVARVLIDTIIASGI